MRDTTWETMAAMWEMLADIMFVAVCIFVLLALLAFQSAKVEAARALTAEHVAEENAAAAADAKAENSKIKEENNTLKGEAFAARDAARRANAAAVNARSRAAAAQAGERDKDKEIADLKGKIDRLGRKTVDAIIAVDGSLSMEPGKAEAIALVERLSQILPAVAGELRIGIKWHRGGQIVSSGMMEVKSPTEDRGISAAKVVAYLKDKTLQNGYVAHGDVLAEAIADLNKTYEPGRRQIIVSISDADFSEGVALKKGTHDQLFRKAVEMVGQWRNDAPDDRSVMAFNPVAANQRTNIEWRRVTQEGGGELVNNGSDLLVVLTRAALRNE